MENLQDFFEKLSKTSKDALIEYVSKLDAKNEINYRFFSYGSNMNEGKFREDTRKSGSEFPLLDVSKNVLSSYKRMLCNKSVNHGLAFTICPSTTAKVEGICHNIPQNKLKVFLKKEGVLMESPSYELLLVKISDEENPVLTLKGLKPTTLLDIDCVDKINAICYLKASIDGAKRWRVDYTDMTKMLNFLEDELCGIKQ